MKHLLPARYLLTMLLACFMALGAQAEPIKFYVSQKRGNDALSLIHISEPTRRTQ